MLLLNSQPRIMHFAYSDWFTQSWLSAFSINLLVVYRESANLIGYLTRRLSAVSINLLVVYRESVNLIGYITRRLSADSLQL